MENPLVSIVVCCHNRRHYLEQTMDSVFAQSYRPVEVIVLDDGSTDGTDGLMAAYGDRIRYVWQEQRGIARARTAACKLAEGELIAFQDDDDLMPSDRIDKLYAALRDYPAAVFAVGDYAYIDPDGNLTGERWMPGSLDERAPPTLLDNGQLAVLWPFVPGVPHTTLFRKSDGEKVGWFDAAFTYAYSDADFFARLGCLGPVIYIRQIVSYYRRGHSALWKNKLRADYSRLQLFEKHYGLTGEDDGQLRARLRGRIQRILRQIAYQQRHTRDFDDSALKGYVQRALELLGLPARVSYYWDARVIGPLKGLARRTVKRE